MYKRYVFLMAASATANACFDETLYFERIDGDLSELFSSPTIIDVSYPVQLNTCSSFDVIGKIWGGGDFSENFVFNLFYGLEINRISLAVYFPEVPDGTGSAFRLYDQFADPLSPLFSLVDYGVGNEGENMLSSNLSSGEYLFSIDDADTAFVNFTLSFDVVKSASSAWIDFTDFDGDLSDSDTMPTFVPVLPNVGVVAGMVGGDVAEDDVDSLYFQVPHGFDAEIILRESEQGLLGGGPIKYEIYEGNTGNLGVFIAESWLDETHEGEFINPHTLGEGEYSVIIHHPTQLQKYAVEIVLSDEIFSSDFSFIP